MAEIHPNPIVFLPNRFKGLADILENALERTHLVHAEAILPASQARYFSHIGLSAICAIGPPALTLRPEPIEDDLLWDNQKMGGKTTLTPNTLFTPTLIGFTSPTRYAEAISCLHARALTGEEEPETFTAALDDLLFSNKNNEFDTKWAAYLPEEHE
ncbi:hypothetical protein EYC59_00120 [Candidatus Saccharibacteria bacterium]|nr:MAG: hypothetical protein EYC59_00120 [Candidatus Saccharibacteria bacterium]